MYAVQTITSTPSCRSKVSYTLSQSRERAVRDNCNKGKGLNNNIAYKRIAKSMMHKTITSSHLCSNMLEHSKISVLGVKSF